MSNVFFFDNPTYQSLVVFRTIVPGKDTHHLIYLLLSLCSILIDTFLFIRIKQIPANYKLFSSYALSQPHIVYFDDPKLYLHFLSAVVIVELHFSEQQLCIIVVLHLKLESFWHVSDNLSRIRS